MPATIGIIKIAFAGAMICLLALWLNILGQTRGSRPRDQSEVVRVYTDLVQTDVTVFDKEGRFAEGLRKEDFELRLDGKVRQIEFFERVEVGSVSEESQLAAARGTLSPGKSGPPAVPLDRGRTVFFYVDDFHLSLSSVVATRKLITGFIDRDMNQNDEVAIASTSGQIGFLQQLTDNKTVLRNALRRLNVRPYSVRDLDRPAMTEYQALLIDQYDRDVSDFFIEETVRQNPGINRPTAENIVRGRATSLLQQAGNITRSTLFGLDQLVKSCSSLSGRKLVFFVSDGFFLDDRNSDAMEMLRRITSSAARSGVVVYSFDARGLVASLADPSMETAFDPSGRLERASRRELFASQDALNALARDTGGRPVFNTNALEVGLARAIKETSVYYLLAWKPEPGAQASSKFRRIEVRLLGKPDLTARVRRGFFDVDPGLADSKSKKQKPTTKSPQAQLHDVMVAPYPNRSIPIALCLNYVSELGKKILLSSSMQISGEFLSFGTENDKQAATVRISGAFYNDRGQLGARFEELLTVAAPYGQVANDVVYSYPVSLGPGLYQVRVAARDEKSGRAGSAHAWIEIPDLSTNKLVLSSLIIGRRRQNVTISKSSNSIPFSGDFGLSIDHQFQRNSTLRFLIFAYNTARAAANSLPDVAAQVQVLRDNQPVVTTALRKVPAEGVDLDRLPYAADLPLDDLPTGRYVLQVTLIDRVSKTSASQQTRFGIE